MYRSISPLVLKELEESGDVVFSVKNVQFAQSTPWVSVPHKISFLIGPECEHIFDCLIQKYDNQIYVSQIEIAGLLRKEEQGLVDAYLYLTIKKLIKFAKVLGKSQLIIDSYIPSTAEHLLDLGFYLYPSNIVYRGAYDLTKNS